MNELKTVLEYLASQIELLKTITDQDRLSLFLRDTLIRANKMLDEIDEFYKENK